MGDVKIPVNSGEFPVFVAIPERAAPRPGAVVLHDVGGMKEDLRNQTRWLAQEGFLAAVPNLYFRGGMMKCLFAIARDLKARRGPTYDDIEAVRAWLIRQEGCTGKIGVIGFCMGAEFARELSPGRRALALALPPENEESTSPERGSALEQSKPAKHISTVSTYHRTERQQLRSYRTAPPQALYLFHR